MPEESKVVIVTGASQGLGEGIARGFLARGWRVVATSRRIEPSDDPNLLALRGDIAEPETGRRLVEAAMDRFGRLDTLVNNAGVFIGGAFTDHTPDQYRTLVATNLDGFFHATQPAVEAMERQGRGGHVVQISTTLAEQANSAFPCVLAAMTKGGLNAATRSLAIEYAGRNIRANAVSPGVIDTPMHAPETHAALARTHPLGRIGQVADVVRAVLYLEDSPFVTGEILHVDGGWSAGG
ncbi:SDR family NAD(P)-dependent oxidoreductase [Aureimonas sp. AU4]|uniref:SDR family NAD(P)-dependent oxidoreductase n=1 Tax=Aureimonas sp. AU4 TaxID=1638163 RepID=UPI00070631AF|nr:SDR family oxidoreductase [Aureimonas sp. AU4]BAT30307.1 short-chain dehydrogenase/reductase SDR [Aureimonas sp. AU4]